MPWVRTHAGGVRLDVRVIPRASKTVIAGERDGALLIRLAAPPVDGAANDALIGFLARILDVPRRNVSLVRGDTARTKTLDISGIGERDARARLVGSA
ncbi:MAG: DUF167 domain-containing protein [Acidobacteria bacterium]|nr:DUF167 domain-containing protein [Acidobacteriota bacterium]